MAWETTEWACGHTGKIQLYGPQRQRDSRIASEAGRKCFACWLVEKWAQEGDPRATKPDRYRLAAAIAENKGIRIFNLPEDAPASDSREALRAERDKLLARLAEIDAELGKDQKKPDEPASRKTAAVFADIRDGKAFLCITSKTSDLLCPAAMREGSSAYDIEREIPADGNPEIVRSLIAEMEKESGLKLEPSQTLREMGI